MMGGTELKQDLQKVEDYISALKRKDMMAKMDRNHYVSNIEGGVWGFESVLDDINLRLVGKIKLLNGLIMKYDGEAAATMPRPE